MVQADTLFPIYDVLVNEIFGSILVSCLALFVVILIIALLGRWSASLLFFWVLLYVLVFTVAYFGVLGAVLLFIGGWVYLISQLFSIWMRD